METIIDKLQKRASDVDLEVDPAAVFQLLEVGLCILCCRDGARGGNKNCGAETIAA
jgi:hypothetical protein